jgi:hypothetical protein
MADGWEKLANLAVRSNEKRPRAANIGKVPTTLRRLRNVIVVTEPQSDPWHRHLRRALTFQSRGMTELCVNRFFSW